MTFLLVVLASFRITRLFTTDSLFDRQREWFFKRWPPNDEYCKLIRERTKNGTEFWRVMDNPWRKPSKWGQLVACPYCIGFWISGFVVLCMAQSTSITMPVLWWLATSSAVGLTAKSLDG